MKTLLCLLLMACPVLLRAQTPLNQDVYDTGKGNLTVTLLGHSSLIFEYNDMVIHVDPFSSVADYGTLPKADLIVLTHEHADHLDTRAIDKIKTNQTKFIMNGTCYDQLKTGEVLKNGGKTKFNKIAIEAVQAYNIVHKKPDGEAYHPKGVGNGYVFTFGKLRVYVGADTENIPEMTKLKNIDIAFLPMNLPYTMTPEMAADAAKIFKPKYLYPYHHSGINDVEKLKKLLEGSGITVVVKNNGYNIIPRVK